MALIDVANTIKTVEGWFKSGSLSQRLNNPGNLMYAGQPGATPEPIYNKGVLVGTFASFATPEAGDLALQKQIQLDASRGLSIQEFANKYAPSGHGNNDPNAYALQIANATGLSINDPLSAALQSQQPDAPSVIDQLEASLDSGAGSETDLTTIAVAVGISLAGAFVLSRIV